MSRRMRQALAEFRETGGVGGDEPDFVGDGEPGTETDPLGQRVAALEEESRGLRELAEGQTRQLEELTRRVAALEGTKQQADDTETVDAGDDQERDWRPPRRRPGMPGPRVIDGSAGSRVERATTAVRRWELEAEMLRDFHLTLPPEKEPLDDWQRKDHVHWMEEALAEARRVLSRAKRMRLLTLGLWWK